MIEPLQSPRMEFNSNVTKLYYKVNELVEALNELNTPPDVEPGTAPGDLEPGWPHRRRP